MRKLLWLGELFLLIATAASPSVSAYAGANKNIQNSFVGAWRLAELAEEGADGKIDHSDSTGLLVFTRDGHMSVQVMQRNPPTRTTAGPEQYSQGGYEASFGTYEVNEGARTFAFQVEGSLVRTLIGKDLSRAFEFSGNRLIVKSTRPEEHWRAVWEHY